MSYTEILEEIENKSIEETFKRLFYDRAKSLSQLETANQQLIIAQNYLAETAMDIEHFIKILNEREIIKEEEGVHTITYKYSASVIWKLTYNYYSKEILCTCDEITNFNKKINDYV